MTTLTLALDRIVIELAAINKLVSGQGLIGVDISPNDDDSCELCAYVELRSGHTLYAGFIDDVLWTEERRTELELMFSMLVIITNMLSVDDTTPDPESVYKILGNIGESFNELVN